MKKEIIAKPDPMVNFLKKEVIILQQRKVYNATDDARNIISDVFVNGKWLCYFLEDEIRADGKKVKGKTCIPAGEYQLKLTWSNRFKRNLPLVYNKPDLTVEGKGIKFSGIRIHGGNTEADTEGCLLCGHYVNAEKTKISGSYVIDSFIRILAANPGKVKLIIQDLPFTTEGLDNKVF